MIQKILHLINTYILFFTTGLLLAIITPAAAVEPPKNPNSAKGCAICHYRWVDTFFIEGKGSELVEYQSEKVVATPEMCFSCHDGSVKDSRVRMINGYGHKTNMPPPAGMKIPEILPLDKDGKMQCATCHTAHGVPSGPDSQETIFMRISNKDSAMCRECHSDKKGGIVAGNHPMGTAEQPIPKKLIEWGAVEGRKKNQIICETCHTAHGSTNERYLIQDNRKSDLCLACHPDKQRLEKTKHNLALSAKSEKNLEGETVMESGMCSACHLTHKAARKPYEKGKIADRTTALCMSCHAAGMVAESKKLAGYIHPVDVRLPEIAGDTDRARYRTVVLKTEGLNLPLFNQFGVMDKMGKITCNTCHDSHGGTFVKKTPAAENGPSNTANTLLRKPSPEICRECHAHKFTIENSRHDLNTVFPNGNEIIKQKVSQPDLCRYCHLIHSSEPDGFIWKKKITTQTGEQVEDMCTTCHAKNGLAPEMAVGKNSHPVNTPLTGNTHTKKLPLFNAAGKMTEKGIMTCFTCHDPHRWSPIKSESGTYVSIEGRPASHFLRIEVAPTSDLCISCHEEKADVLQSDHNLLITAPDVKNALGWTPYESGVCGVCHIVHNSSEKIDLWAMAPGTGSNVMERMCNSCHSQNGAAAAKVPVISSHPDTLFVSIWESGKGGAQPFPFFDIKTGRLSAVGNISCPSCHDVHHWGANSIQVGVQKNIEGDAMTSFLRPRVPDRVCAQCHGLDGLFVFKYFHNAEIRSKK